MQVNKSYVEADWSVGNVTAPIALNHRGGAIAAQIVVTGTINFDIQSSNSDLQAGASGSWLVGSTDAAGITASKWLTLSPPTRFIRILVNSFTTGATITVNLVQEDV